MKEEAIKLYKLDDIIDKYELFVKFKNNKEIKKKEF